MPPKGSRGRGRGHRPNANNSYDHSVEEAHDVLSIGDASDSSSVIMTGRRPIPSRSSNTRGPRTPRGNRPVGLPRPRVPDIYQDLLQETLQVPVGSEVSERPRKRRRVKRSGDSEAGKSATTNAESLGGENEVGIDLFENVLPNADSQIIYQDTDEDSDGSDHEWEQLNLGNNEDRDESDTSADLNLTLNLPSKVQSVGAPRRKAVSRVERGLRLEIHKMHILCLISAVQLRNQWCNNHAAQGLLLPLVNKKILGNLRPPAGLSQFRQTDLLKEGLTALIPVWNARFSTTARGMRKALWAEDDDSLRNFKPPPDIEPAMFESDFVTAAKLLRSSRDIGAILFCSLLRATGLEVRLVCSLQALPFGTTSSTIAPVISIPGMLKSKTPDLEDNQPVDIHDKDSPFRSGNASTPNAPFTARRRLGHPRAADYHIPSMVSPKAVAPKPSPLKPKHIHESSFPVFWVEVLDEAHQRWIAVDPLVTRTVGKAQRLEPPQSDTLNGMAYVLAFEDDGVIRDVTRRYTKAYNAKTRKLRVESTEKGDKWWRKTMRRLGRNWHRDLDEIEDSELAGIEAREPMPKNISDFKDHPIYALERHLRQNEVLVRRNEIGKVTAGKNKSMESVFRRSDVKLARSADRWYRLGKDVKMGEQPVKILPPKKHVLDIMEDDTEREASGTALYTELQTQIYIPPPVVNGRVPRNVYGNIDIYVPSMIPAGGCHIPFEEAKRAALLMQVDYAEAVTGFKFHGRRGTPIVNGIIAPIEFREAILAVVEGFRDERRKAEDDMKRVAALRLWRLFFVGLKVKERVDGYELEGEMGDFEEEARGVPDDNVDGGFIPEAGEGGFIPEHIHLDMDDEKRLVRNHHELTEGQEREMQDSDDHESETMDLSGGFFPEVAEDDTEDGGFLQIEDAAPTRSANQLVSETESLDVDDDSAGMESEEYEMHDDGEGGGFLVDD